MAETDLAPVLALAAAGAEITDEALLRANPCIGLELRKGRRQLVFSPGARGPLSAAQARMCPTVTTRPITAEERDRLVALSRAGAQCARTVKRSDGVEALLGCMSKELRANGQEGV